MAQSGSGFSGASSSREGAHHEIPLGGEGGSSSEAHLGPYAYNPQEVAFCQSPMAAYFDPDPSFFGTPEAAAPPVFQPAHASATLSPPASGSPHLTAPGSPPVTVPANPEKPQQSRQALHLSPAASAATALAVPISPPAVLATKPEARTATSARVESATETSGRSWQASAGASSAVSNNESRKLSNESRKIGREVAQASSSSSKDHVQLRRRTPVLENSGPRRPCPAAVYVDLSGLREKMAGGLKAVGMTGRVVKAGG